MANLNRGPAASALPNLQGQLKNNQGKVYAFADLPTDPNTPNGTTAWTSDQGLCRFNGTTWGGVGIGYDSSATVLWNKVATASVASASDTFVYPSLSTKTFTVTANAGVTAFFALVQGSNDGGTTWVTFGSVSLSAPGSGVVLDATPYALYRVNVTSLTGGTASATVATGSSAVASNSFAAPQYSGIPAPGPYLFGQSGVPVLNPPSGSVGNNGALTLGTALPGTYTSLYVYFAAGQVYSGSVAGLYYVVMSSSTLGTIYNNILGNAFATIPASPTPIVATGPGAFTGYVVDERILLQIELPGGTLGPNGALYLRAQMTFSTDAGQSASLHIGATPDNPASTTLWHNVAAASNGGMGFDSKLTNRGVQNKQIATAVAGSYDLGLSSSNIYYTIDTSVRNYLQVCGYIGTATHYAILEAVAVEILPG